MKTTNVPCLSFTMTHEREAWHIGCFLTNFKHNQRVRIETKCDISNFHVTSNFVKFGDLLSQFYDTCVLL